MQKREAVQDGVLLRYAQRLSNGFEKLLGDVLES
jgi:hypothetical protein